VIRWGLGGTWWGGAFELDHAGGIALGRIGVEGSCCFKPFFASSFVVCAVLGDAALLWAVKLAVFKQFSGVGKTIWRVWMYGHDKERLWNIIIQEGRQGEMSTYNSVSSTELAAL
jgi:hypothetical protein